MLISVLNIKLTCEWHKAIKLNYKNTRTHVIVVLRFPSTILENAQRWRNMADCAFRKYACISVASVSWIAVIWHHTQGRKWIRLSADRYSVWTRKKTTLFSGHYLRNRSTFDIGVLGYSVYFNIRNTLPKSATFLLGNPVFRVSQEECARLRESVPYVKVYRYNPKHLYPKLNDYGDNGLRKVGASCGSKYCNLHSWCNARQRWWPWEWNAVLIVPAWLLVACTGVGSAV